jgi:hypothetical protein
VFPGVDDADCFSGTDPGLYEPLAELLRQAHQADAEAGNHQMDDTWGKEERRRNYPEWPPPDYAEDYVDLTLGISLLYGGGPVWGTQMNRDKSYVDYMGIGAGVGSPISISAMGAQGRASSPGDYWSLTVGFIIGVQVYGGLDFGQISAEVGLTTPQISGSLYRIFEPRR